MAGKAKNLAGQIVGFWTVLEMGPRASDDSIQWHCRCKCGTERVVRAGSLQKGLSTSCGCSRSPDLTGQAFNSWVVISRAETRHGDATWLCRCRCGAERVVLAHGLLSGNSKSCGCPIDPTAIYVGELTADHLRKIVDYNPATGIWTWRFRPDRTERWNEQLAGKKIDNVSGRGYRCINIDGKRYTTHRLAWFYVHGVWPDDQVDHKNTDRSDCRLENLRPATPAQNGRNQGLRANNTSGYKGVSWNIGQKRWVSRITCDGKIIHLGYFDDPKLAHEAYVKAALELHGEFARTE